MKFVCCLLGVFGIFVLSLPAAATNIVLITVDDMGTQTSLLQDEAAITPNLDRLAAQGVSFTSAFTPAQLCQPSRTALLSGRRPLTTGVVHNNQAIDWSTITTLPERLRAVGYRAVASGKVTHRETCNSLPWDACQPRSPSPKPDERPAGHDVPALGDLDWAELLEDESEWQDYRSAGFAIAEIEAHASTGMLFAMVGLTAPHAPFYNPVAYFDLHPPFLPIDSPEGDLDDIPPPGIEMAATSRYDLLVENDLRGELRRAYYASVTFADAMIGRILDAVEASGEPTLIAVVGDHGYFLAGEEDSNKHTVRKGPMWSQGFQTSFVAALTGTSTARKVDDPVNIMDLHATALDLAGASDPNDESISLLPYLTDSNHSSNRFVAGIARGAQSQGGEPDPIYVRGASRRWTYIGYRNSIGKTIGEELYNRPSDPGEYTNLATDPSQAIRLRVLRRRTLRTLGLSGADSRFENGQ